MLSTMNSQQQSCDDFAQLRAQLADIRSNCRFVGSDEIDKDFVHRQLHIRSVSTRCKSCRVFEFEHIVVDYAGTDPLGNQHYVIYDAGIAELWIKDAEGKVFDIDKIDPQLRLQMLTVKSNHEYYVGFDQAALHDNNVHLALIEYDALADRVASPSRLMREIAAKYGTTVPEMKKHIRRARR